MAAVASYRLRVLTVAVVLVLALRGCEPKRPGYERLPAAPLHALWPMTGSAVASPRPRVRWSATSPLEGVRVEFCRDRWCASPIIAVDVPGDSPGGTSMAVPPVDLPPGAVFWRLRAQGRDGAATAPTPAWYFLVGPGAHVAGGEDIAFALRGYCDADGDGRGDLIDDDGGVYLRGAGARATSTLAQSGDTRSVCADFDGDGYPDVAGVDTRRYGATGAAYLYRGPVPAGDVQADAVFPLGMAGDARGDAAALAGDLDADGYSDLVVSYPGVQDDRGVVVVYRGGPAGLETIPALTLESPAGAGGRFQALAVGDADGDGDADLLVGAPTAIGHEGYAALHLGGPDGLDPAPSWQRALDFGGFDGAWGSSGAIGDVDGDGRAELLVGAARAAALGGCIVVLDRAEAGGRSTWSERSRMCGPNQGLALAGLGDAVALIDLAGDGRQEVAGWLHLGASARAALFRQDPASAGGWSERDFALPREGPAFVDGLRTLDVNGDGYLDLLLPTREGGREQFYYVAGSPHGPADALVPLHAGG